MNRDVLERVAGVYNWHFHRVRHLPGYDSAPHEALVASDQGGFVMTPGELEEIVEGLIIGFDVLGDAIPRNNEAATARMNQSIPGPDKKIEVKERTPVSKYVYLMDNGRFCKIGVSNDVEARRRTIEMMSGMDVRLVHSVWSTDALWLEQHLHDELSDHRRRGEWFELDESMVSLAVSLMDAGVA